VQNLLRRDHYHHRCGEKGITAAIIVRKPITADLSRSPSHKKISPGKVDTMSDSVEIIGFADRNSARCRSLAAFPESPFCAVLRPLTQSGKISKLQEKSSARRKGSLARLQVFGPLHCAVKLIGIRRYIICSISINLRGSSRDSFRTGLVICQSIRFRTTPSHHEINGSTPTDFLGISGPTLCTTHDVAEREHPPAALCAFQKVRPILHHLGTRLQIQGMVIGCADGIAGSVGKL
jgi:hypothetical protein